MGPEKKIFIVDDDEMLSMALQDYLSKDPLNHISHFTTGEACREHLGEEPDVIILDYYLDSVDREAHNGMEILDEFKKVLPDTRFIMLSSQDSYAKAAQLIAHGADNYVMKGEQAFEEIRQLI